ncbi:DUF3618 domain-containing protein [Phycicoccus sp. HDW14]|uniref:DUF3618 domain-containing protein n=1 Tax=Phycicoccus sp. HDW14 TaxID=2714941 RepID=UPI00140780AB|nr:DUF3618 domain-containing protein [Phycicoccus sp. HDW14]QIM21878.1 DUF3618 domain-containing protein [Phycicoccus sp. HDW14]
MTAADTPTPGSAGPGRTPEEIEAHIAATREALAETVDALGAKLDVRARAADRVATVRASLTDEQGRPTAPAWGGLAAAAGLTALVVWRRSRR